MINAHTAADLKQMQSLPLEAKIRMTKERIKVWYESWHRFEIKNDRTGKTRFETIDTRTYGAQPKLKENEYIVSEFPGAVYLSLSGGKDSTVLKHIIDDMTRAGSIGSVPAVFVNTGLEYPELQKFVKEIKSGKYECFNSDVEIIRPEMRFDEVIKKYGYPVISKQVSKYIKEGRNAIKKGNMEYYAIKKLKGELLNKDGGKSIYNCEKWGFMLDAPYKISSQCCDVMKKRPAKKYDKSTGRKPYIATMASESQQRYMRWIKNGCNAFEKNNPSSQPISFWTEQDVLHYIKKYNVPYCPVYGDIVVDDNAEIEGQTSLIDFISDYEETDKLKTTGCDRTGCIFCMFGCHLEKAKTDSRS